MSHASTRRTDVLDIPTFLRNQQNLADERAAAGPCAKKVVRCTIVSKDGQHFVGDNSCDNPQAACPRIAGEGYEKCKSICRQASHAEVSALRRAGAAAIGARAYIEGIGYACRECQESLFGAGIESVSIGVPRHV